MPDFLGNGIDMLDHDEIVHAFACNDEEAVRAMLKVAMAAGGQGNTSVSVVSGGHLSSHTGTLRAA